MDDVTTLHGPNTAEASAASGLFNTPKASPVAMPPFCIPTSMATVRESAVFMPPNRAQPYPSA